METKEPDVTINPEIISEALSEPIKQLQEDFLHELYQILNLTPPVDASDTESQKLKEKIDNVLIQFQDQTQQALQSLPYPADKVWEHIKPLVEEIINKAVATATNIANEAKKEVQAVEGRVTSLEESVTDLYKHIQEKVNEIVNPKQWFDNGVDYAKEEFNNKFIPELDKLESTTEFLAILHSLSEVIDDLEDRITWAGDIMCFIFEPSRTTPEQIEGSTSRKVTNDIIALIKVGEELTQVKSVEEFETQMESAAKCILDIIEKTNPSIIFIEAVINAIKVGKVTPPDFIHGLTAGRIDEFLNSKLPGGEAEREFRVEILGAIDQLIHTLIDVSSAQIDTNGSQAGNHAQTSSANQVSYMLIAKFIDGLFRALAGKILTIPGLPSLHLPSNILTVKTGTEPLPVAIKASRMLSQSIEMPVRGVTGLISRGFWEVNFLNDGISETITSILSSFVGSVYESVVYSLLSVIEIREVYSLPDEDDTDNIIFCSWEIASRSGEKLPPGTMQSYNTIVLNTSLMSVIPKLQDPLTNALKAMLGIIIPIADGQIKKDPMIMRILKDYAAIMEIERRYNSPPDSTDNQIQDTSATREKDTITFQATMILSANESPAVVRAYCNGQCYIMKHQLKQTTCNYSRSISTKEAGTATHVHFLEGSRNYTSIEIH